MLFIWTGRGYLVAVIVVGSSLAANLLANTITGSDTYYDETNWVFGVSLLFSGVLCWPIGRFLATRKIRVLIDKETGEEIRSEAKHTLFFIPMHWWGPILCVIGAVLVLNEFFR